MSILLLNAMAHIFLHLGGFHSCKMETFYLRCHFSIHIDTEYTNKELYVRSSCSIREAFKYVKLEFIVFKVKDCEFFMVTMTFLILILLVLTLVLFV